MDNSSHQIVGLKDLRQNIDKYASLVNKGTHLTVLRRSKPIFNITPLKDKQGQWETVIDFTKIKRGGVDIDDLLKRL